MFEESTYETHQVEIINRMNLSNAGYCLEYAFGEAGPFIRADYYVSVKERFELMDEFYKTGKLSLQKLQLYTMREETEVIEPSAIRFLPVENVYVKTPAMIQIPSVLEPRKFWHRSDFERWNREVVEVKFNHELSQEEQYKSQIEIAQRYGMKLKEK